MGSDLGGPLVVRTKDCLDRIRFYIAGTRKEDVISASNSRLNGYNAIAMEHENRIQLASLILADLAKEIGE